MKHKIVTLYDISRTEQIIICALYQKELYGLAIQKLVEQASGKKLTVKFGSLYPALDNLEKKDLVKSRWGDDRPQERKGARRKYYTLTSEGNRIFQEFQEFYQKLQNDHPPLE